MKIGNSNVLQMKTLMGLLIMVCFVVISSELYSQETESKKIVLQKASVEQTANYAVWRTDFYICTGIAYAKSLGKTPEDFAQFVGNAHAGTMQSSKGKGLEPIVQLFYFLTMNYINGEFEILKESESEVIIKTNRPWDVYFKEGPVLGVTLKEFELCYLSHVIILLDSIDLNFEYKVEGNYLISTVSVRS